MPNARKYTRSSWLLTDLLRHGAQLPTDAAADARFEATFPGCQQGGGRSTAEKRRAALSQLVERGHAVRLTGYAYHARPVTLTSAGHQLATQIAARLAAGADLHGSSGA